MDIITNKTNGQIQDFIRRRHEFFSEAQMEQFSACATDRDRYAIVAETLGKRREAMPMIITEAEEEKNLERALEYKAKGNNLFKDSEWADAMKCYTLSYLQTPQDKSKREWARVRISLFLIKLSALFRVSPLAAELAVIFANRSAALHHMGRNELSLRDIHRALELGYPDDMEYKLRERQARCHLANKNAYEAMEAFK